MKIVVVQGIGRRFGGPDRFASRLMAEGYEVLMYRYQVRYPWSYWSRRKMANDVGSLINQCDEGDHIVCHSNGAVIWQESIKAGFRWGKCMVLGGAGTSDRMVYPPECFESAVIYYNPEDKAIWWGAKIPWHPFGMLGRVGYAGPKDKRIENVSLLHARFGSSEHGHYFKPPFFDQLIQDAKAYFGPRPQTDN